MEIISARGEKRSHASHDLWIVTKNGDARDKLLSLEADWDREAPEMISCTHFYGRPQGIDHAKIT